MSNKLKFLIIIFLAIFFLCPSAEAEDLIPYAEDGQSLGSEGLAYYAGQILKFGIVISAILAVVMIVIAGFQFITAGGNPSMITSARNRIQNALLGLLIVIGSWLILYTINPDLININLESISTFKPSGIEKTSLTSKQIETMCTKQCGIGGYQYNATTNMCNCYGGGTHKECKLVAGLKPGEMDYQCETVNFPGTDTCSDDLSCKQKLNCCICDYYVYDNCTSGTNITEVSCEDKCHSSWTPWKYFYTSGAKCNTNDECVAQ